MNFKSMSIEKLAKLKRQVESALASKVAETRRMLEAQLAGLTKADITSTRGWRGGLRGKVAPKYRNPDNPSETWAGRGLKPRWLVAALKGGKKLEHFSIEKAAKKTRKAKVARKARAKKVRKPRSTMRPRTAQSSAPSPAAAPQA
jgi:DNA-binding protein H-NS